MVILTKMEWGRIGFCARIGEIQICTDLAHDEPIREDLIMDEVDGDSNVLDASYYCLGL